MILNSVLFLFSFFLLPRFSSYEHSTQNIRFCFKLFINDLHPLRPGLDGQIIPDISQNPSSSLLPSQHALDVCNWDISLEGGMAGVLHGLQGTQSCQDRRKTYGEAMNVEPHLHRPHCPSHSPEMGVEDWLLTMYSWPLWLYCPLSPHTLRHKYTHPPTHTLYTLHTYTHPHMCPQSWPLGSSSCCRPGELWRCLSSYWWPLGNDNWHFWNARSRGVMTEAMGS